MIQYVNNSKIKRCKILNDPGTCYKWVLPTRNVNNVWYTHVVDVEYPKIVIFSLFLLISPHFALLSYFSYYFTLVAFVSLLSSSSSLTPPSRFSILSLLLFHSSVFSPSSSSLLFLFSLICLLCCLVYYFYSSLLLLLFIHLLSLVFFHPFCSSFLTFSYNSLTHSKKHSWTLAD